MTAHNKLTRHGRGAVVTAAFLLAVSCMQVSAGTPEKTAFAGGVRPDDLEVRRMRLNTFSKGVAERLFWSPSYMEMPAEDVCRVMAAGERKDLAIAAGVMYDRLLSTNVCSVAELEWERRSLALLRLNDGAEAAAIISHVHNTPLHQVFSLEQLSRIETMIRAIYPELVASNETDDVIFDRSAAKKALIRRQLFLLRGNVQ